MRMPDPAPPEPPRPIAPLCPTGAAWYPVYLDILESLRRQVPELERLWALTCDAVAPSHDDLCRLGLTGVIDTPIRASDIGASDEAAIVQNQLATLAAQAVARLPQPVCLQLGHLGHWDPASLEFLTRLLREDRHCRIVVRAQARPAVLPALAEGVSLAPAKAGPRRRPAGRPGPADDYLALCPHGLPVRVLERLGLPPSDLADHVTGPDGQPVAQLSAARRKRLLRHLPPARRALMHGALYDAIGPQGWNYIRRIGHAIGSGDLQRLRESYSCAVAGLLRCGYDFVYDLLVAMTPHLHGTEREAISLCAARLAPRLQRKHGRRLAVGHYKMALATQSQTADRIATLHELANLLANSRRPGDLKAARRHFGAAFALLPALPEGQDRDDLEIRLRNGLALLDYKAGDGEAALTQERKALDIALRRAEADDKHRRWSEPLLRTNTSKLLLRLFGDGEAALAQLMHIPDATDSRTRFSKMQNLGRMQFELGNFPEARRCLADCLATGDVPGSYAEDEELLDLCLFSVASFRCGCAVESHRLQRMAYLARVTKSPQAREWVDRLGAALRPLPAPEGAERISPATLSPA